MEERSGDAMDINTFQVTMQTGIVLVMTLQMCFDTKNWTILNVSAILGSAIAYFIFSGLYYSKGAYELSINTFKLVGVAPHVWGIVTPWLVIILVLAIYLIFVLAWRFVQILYFKSVQDKALDQQRAEKAAIKEQKVNQSSFSRGSTRRNSRRSMHKTQSSFAFATSDNKPGQMIREGSLRVSSLHSSRMASPRMRKVPENTKDVSEAEQATHVKSYAF